MQGTFKKIVRPLTINEGVSAQTIRHAKELLNAIEHAYSDKMKCRLLLVRGTKYGTSEGKVRAALDGNPWLVEQFSGTVETGFQFTLVRTE